MNLVLLILTIMQAILCIIAFKINDNQEKTANETLDLCKRIVDEKEKVIKILLYAKLHDEIPEITLDKIEKELDMPIESI